MSTRGYVLHTLLRAGVSVCAWVHGADLRVPRAGRFGEDGTSGCTGLPFSHGSVVCVRCASCVFGSVCGAGGDQEEET